MEQLNVGGSYDEILRSLQPQEYIRQPRPGTFEVPQPFTAPPLNTDIRFLAAVPPKHLTEAQYLTVAAQPLPETWDWRNEYPEDDEIVRKKKKQLTVVPNQGLCGSCWAISTAGLISDLFITSGISEENPVVSTTYCMSCYPQHKCGGGNPAVLLKDIEKGGAATDICVDYSWCLQDDVCGGKATQHFNASTETARLNGLIPKCGCRGSDRTEHAVYYVKDPQVVTSENDNHDIGPLIRSHIYNVGPVIGGYHVFKNFMSGDYTATGGIYFENYDYASDRWLNPSESPLWTGSHAVCVVGWGLSSPINIPLPDVRAHEVRVPYWYCRNSWGHKWGIDKGYFRIAAYPFNKKSQFERSVVIQPQNMMSGGFMLCYPDKMIVTDKVRNVMLTRVGKQDLVAASIYGKSQEYEWKYLLIAAAVAIIVAIVVMYAASRYYKKNIYGKVF
jgi:hypothetical protein